MPLTFKRPLLSLILQGKKTQTRRLPNNHQLQEGRIYAIMDDWTEGPKAYVRITRKFQQRLGDITQADIQKEGFNTLEEFKALWIRLYGEWNPNQTVIVYEFEVVG